MCNISLFPFSSLFTEKTASFFYEAVNSSNSVLDGHCVGYGNNTRITYCFYCVIGGEGGIRTLGTLLTYTRFPGEHLQPLGHLSGEREVISPHFSWQIVFALTSGV